MSSFRISKGELQQLTQHVEEQNLPKEVLQRLQWFLHYASHRSVSKTCEHFGIARTTFYRWFRRFDPQHLETLLDQPTTPPMHKRSSYEPSVVPVYEGIAHEKTEVDSEVKTEETKPIATAWLQLPSFILAGLVSNTLLIIVYLILSMFLNQSGTQLNASVLNEPQSSMHCTAVSIDPETDTQSFTCTLSSPHER